MSAVTFTSWGSATSIGPSCHVFDFDGYRVGVDYGADNRQHNVEPQFEGELHALFLTHGHRDHVGMVPRAIRRWPKMLCWATQQTRELALWIWEDGVSIEERQQRSHAFSLVDAQCAFDRIQRCEIGQPIQLNSELSVMPFAAGHILGAVGFIFTFRGDNYVITGDIGLRSHGLIGGAQLPSLASTRLLVCESTYAGVYRTKTRAHISHEFIKAVWSVLDDGGRVLVPTLAIDRMQEVYQLLHESGIDHLYPLWVIGGSKPTEIYRRYTSGAKALSTMQRFSSMPHQFRVQKNETPVVVLASSGMMMRNTPSYVWATTLLHEPGSAILMVNWQDPCELGGKLLASSKNGGVELDGDMIPTRCHVQRFDFSSHAKQDDMDEIVARLNPERIIHVHGDEDRIDAYLATALDRHRRLKVSVGEVVSV